MFVRVNFDQPINDLVEEFLTEEFVPVNVSQPAVDVAESENESVIVAELPGVKKEDVSISVENGWLTLKGERKTPESSEIKRVLHREIAYQPFSRAIKLPHPVNIKDISAELTNGILTISLPKAEEVRARAIEIK